MIGWRRYSEALDQKLDKYRSLLQFEYHSPTPAEKRFVANSLFKSGMIATEAYFFCTVIRRRVEALAEHIPFAVRTPACGIMKHMSRICVRGRQMES